VDLVLRHELDDPAASKKVAPMAFDERDLHLQNREVAITLPGDGPTLQLHLEARRVRRRALVQERLPVSRREAITLGDLDPELAAPL